MPAPQVLTVDELVAVLKTDPERWWSAAELALQVDASRPTLARRLGQAIAEDYVQVRGAGPSTRYRLRPGIRLHRRRADVVGRSDAELPPIEPGPVPARGHTGPRWSDPAVALLDYVRLPRAAREPVTYNPSLVENYRPNESYFLPAALRHKLFTLGKATGERPAGTYTRDILGQLLVDLSWRSSAMEGNRYTRLETKRLIEAGQAAEGKSRQEAVMILNHKNAIEFLADVAPFDDPLSRVVSNIHALLMDGLLANADALGGIRREVVTITDSVYTPWQVPSELERLYLLLCEKADAITDPVEAAFFLFSQLPYLQPFEDGNKRTSRISCNLPLARANLAPLAFLDIEDSDYFAAFLGLYERADVSAVIDLFEFAYERSVQQYIVMRQAMQEPDPFRMRLRGALSEAVRLVVADGLASEATVEKLGLDAADVGPFRALLESELRGLSDRNYARYGLRYSQFAGWQKGQGR